MSSPIPAADSPAATRYPSLAALQAAHNDLLRRQRQDGDTPGFRAAVLEFLRSGTATGALLDADADRRAAQSMLDYWVARLYRVGEEPPDAALDDFDPLLAPTLPDALCPFLGLDAFREEDQDKFFGRQELIAKLIERLADHRLLAVVGPSGSGKSSLVRAGVIPALKAGALHSSEDWRYLPPIVPGSHPLANLNRVLRTANQEPRTADSSSVLGSPVLRSPIVLVVDQFEELFTLCDDETARQAFIARLLDLAKAPDAEQQLIARLLGLAETSAAEHHVILTMRSDFETFVARAPQLQALFEDGRVQVTPLSASELREVIELPAETVGLKFEAGVVDLLLQDILGEPAGLPLLQFTLLKLWENRARNRVTRAIYDRVGGGRLALARCADKFYAGLIPEEQVTARRILLRMVRPSGGLEITSSRVRRADLYRSGEDPGRIDRVLKKLIEAHLVRLTEGETPGDSQIEVAHEALVRNWPTLVEWLEQEKVALSTRRRLEGRAAEWVRLGQGSGGLLDEVELREAERWLKSSDAKYLRYDPALPALVEASRTAIEKEVQEKEAARQRELELARELAAAKARTARRRGQIAIVLLFLLALAVAVTVYAFIQRNIAEVQLIAYEAQTQIGDAPETAILLAYEAVSRNRNLIGEQTLRDALATPLSSIPVIPLIGHTGRISNAAFSSDGKRIVTASDDGTARVWNIDGKQLTILQHAKVVFSAAFSPNDQRIITASNDNTARLWSVDGELLATFSGHTKGVTSAVFSKTGQRILTTSFDNTAGLWTNNGERMAVLRSRPTDDEVTSAAFSPDEQHIVTTSTDGSIRVWSIEGTPLITISTTIPVYSGTFSPDGQSILTASRNGKAQIWDLSGKLKKELAGHIDRVWNALFSFDGKLILTASYDGTARLWDATTGKLLAVLKGHTDVVWSAVFSPDGQRILTASKDGTARLWSLEGNQLAILAGHTNAVRSAVFSTDGKNFLTASDDMTARLWHGDDPPLPTLTGHAGPVYNAVYSPDGQQVLTASPDYTALLQQRDGQVLASLPHNAAVNSAVFSPSGQHILTASDDGKARLWDLSGKLRVTFSGHNGAVFSAAFSQDNKNVVTASADQTARLWDLAGNSLVIFRGQPGKVWSAVFSPDDRSILTASDDGTARLWDLTGKSIATFQGHTGPIYSAVFSPDGQQVLTASRDRTARLWDLTGKSIATFQGHTGPVYSAVFSPDGQQVLTASQDGTARLWDLTGKSVTTSQGHTGPIRSAVFSPDGTRILTASDDGTARQYLANVDDLLKVAACRVGGGLTEDEIKLFQVPTPLKFDFAKRQCPPVLGS